MKFLQALSVVLFVVVFSSPFSSSVEAKGYQLPESYYPAKLIEGVESQSLKNEALKRELQILLSSKHTNLGYTTAREILFGKIHLESDKVGVYVKDVYCGKIFRSNIGVGQLRIPDSNLLNCEHTWPQSKFTASFSRDLQKSDLHHLYPTDNKANSTRGNHPFSDVDGDTLGSHCDDSRIGSSQMAQQSRGIYFEPPTDHKGNVARALFYFSVRYNMPLDEVQETNLRKWHDEDPADANEQERNDIIQEHQGNRNPFIDSAEIVDLIADF
jgi:deoxyribonuclease-1